MRTYVHDIRSRQLSRKEYIQLFIAAEYTRIHGQQSVVRSLLFSPRPRGTESDGFTAFYSEVLQLAVKVKKGDGKAIYVKAKEIHRKYVSHTTSSRWWTRRWRATSRC